MIFETNNRDDEWCGRYSRFVIYNVPTNVECSVENFGELLLPIWLHSVEMRTEPKTKYERRKLQIASKLSQHSIAYGGFDGRDWVWQ